MRTASAKVTDKFDAMTKEDQTKWLEARKAVDAKREERDAAEKKTVGFDTLTLEAKTVYLANLLKWKEDVYKACQKEPKGKDADCVHANDLRVKAITKRAGDKYWAKSKEDREKDDAAYVNQRASDLKELTAAAVKPPAGDGVGRACGKNEAGVRVKCNEGHCCGYATP